MKINSSVIIWYNNFFEQVKVLKNKRPLKVLDLKIKLKTLKVNVENTNI